MNLWTKLHLHMGCGESLGENSGLSKLRSLLQHWKCSSYRMRGIPCPNKAPVDTASGHGQNSNPLTVSERSNHAR